MPGTKVSHYSRDSGPEVINLDPEIWEISQLIYWKTEHKYVSHCNNLAALPCIPECWGGGGGVLNDSLTMNRRDRAELTIATLGPTWEFQPSCRFSTCKLDHEVVIYPERTTWPATSSGNPNFLSGEAPLYARIAYLTNQKTLFTNFLWVSSPF